MHRSFVSDVCRGVKEPGAKILVGLTEHYGVSASWVLCGQGPMLLHDLEASVAQASDESSVAQASDELINEWRHSIGLISDDYSTRVASLGAEFLDKATSKRCHPLLLKVECFIDEQPEQVGRVEGYLDAILAEKTELKAKTA
jgi:hypothetical protein